MDLEKSSNKFKKKKKNRLTGDEDNVEFLNSSLEAKFIFISLYQNTVCSWDNWLGFCLCLSNKLQPKTS